MVNIIDNSCTLNQAGVDIAVVYLNDVQILEIIVLGQLIFEISVVFNYEGSWNGF
jgi:hypothetical protein